MWQLFLCAGLLFLILEMFTPAMFFLSFAIAALICALLSFFISGILTLTVIFSILSMLLIFVVRPLLIKDSKDKKLKTGMESKYIGKVAKAIEDIDKEKGAISIYDERWQARNVDEGTIEAGNNVMIISYESIVMNVRKV